MLQEIKNMEERLKASMKENREKEFNDMEVKLKKNYWKLHKRVHPNHERCYQQHYLNQPGDTFEHK